jgi:hypothetical protein
MACWDKNLKKKICNFFPFFCLTFGFLNIKLIIFVCGETGGGIGRSERICFFVFFLFRLFCLELEALAKAAALWLGR